MLAAVLADCKEEERMREVFAEHRPTIVFHAAAYKHVGLMESNPVEAVRNNALATRVVAHVAGELGVRRFVLVSTDKAVAPATVMGASKALAEFALEAASARWPGTHYNAVRFGNVLGSSGSVVPIFRRQIARGGPVTVTDERMTRYFMTIPEAVQLIIRSGSLGDLRGGAGRRAIRAARAEVFVLDMGEPVRIVELARAMIELSGLDPDRDIEIEIVGARGGEKLHEQLFNSYERSRPTVAEKILLAEREPLAAETVEAMFAEIGLLVLEGDAAGLAAKVSELSAARGAPEDPEEQPSAEALNGDRRGQRATRCACAPHTLPGFMTALPVALSLSNTFTKIGAIAAFAALVGIAILALLVFSQARELKRLREWAGRAPERSAELEQRVTAGAAARVQQASPPVPPVRQVPRATPVVARPVAAARPPRGRRRVSWRARPTRPPEAPAGRAGSSRAGSSAAGPGQATSERAGGPAVSSPAVAAARSCRRERPAPATARPRRRAGATAVPDTAPAPDRSAATPDRAIAPAGSRHRARQAVPRPRVRGGSGAGDGARAPRARPDLGRSRHRGCRPRARPGPATGDSRRRAGCAPACGRLPTPRAPCLPAGALRRPGHAGGCRRGLGRVPPPRVRPPPPIRARSSVPRRAPRYAPPRRLDRRSA